MMTRQNPDSLKVMSRPKTDPPCKVGDRVYSPYLGLIGTVINCYPTPNHGLFSWRVAVHWDYGKIFHVSWSMVKLIKKP